MKLVIKKLYLWIAVIVVIITAVVGYFAFWYVSQKITRVRVANLTSNSVTITWVSNQKDKGYVLVSDNNGFKTDYQDLINYKKYEDGRGNNSYYTHYVTINDLVPEQKYYFRITDGIKVWDIYSADQSTKWYEIDTASTFSFTTKAVSTSASAPKFPNSAYGFVQPDSSYTVTDSVVLAVADKADESGGLLDNTDSEVLATLVDSNGSWMLDKSQFTSSRLDQNYDYTDNKDFIYVYPQIENILMPGSFAIMGKDDAPFETISLNNFNDPSNIISLKNFLVKPVQAADLSQNLCCGLTISGKSNVYFDYEEAKDCSSCGSCFPVGRQLNSGSILSVQEFKNIEGKNIGEQRKNCESKKLSAGSVYTSTNGGSATGATTSSESFPNGICNTTLKDSDFKVSTVNKDEFVKLADQLGAGNNAKACYNYVVCNAKKDGINPEMALEIWLHESGASNYKMFPTVEDMGIHCYGGNAKYPPYPCNTTPKKNLAMQIGMFDALPHTMCLTNGKFDPVKWAAGFWTGSTCDMSYGETYVSELKLYWGRISNRGSAFPTWIKDTSTAQSNLDCNKNYDDNGGNSNGNGNGNGDNPTPTTTRICCAMLLDGESQFRLDSEKFKNCTDVFPIGGNYHFKDQNKKINYVVQVNINDFNSCEGKVYAASCQNGVVVPTGLKAISDPAGTNTSGTKCVYIDPHKAVRDDGIIDIPVVGGKASSILSFLQKAFAAEASPIASIQGGLVTFNADGLYNVKIRETTINNLPVNADQKYRFYVDKNGDLGYQPADQLVSFNKEDISATKIDDVTRVNVGAGSNLLNLTFQPRLAGKNIKASSFMNYANVEGIKIIFMTSFENGAWQKGLRARTDGQPGYVGEDFVLKGNTGYLIISNTELKDKAALVLPGVNLSPTTGLKLDKGWNLITSVGFKNNTALTLTNAIQTQTNGNVSIAQWVNTKAIYNNLQDDKKVIYGNDFKLSDSLSYFIYVDKPVTVANP